MPKPVEFPKYKERQSHKGEGKAEGESHPHAKLTEERIRFARAQIKFIGYGVVSRLADKWQVSASAISTAVRGESWKHLTWPPPLEKFYLRTHTAKVLQDMLKRAPD